MRRSVLLWLALLLAACGSRTSPLIDAPQARAGGDAGRLDASPHGIDASRADSGREVDASVPRACVLVSRGDPLVVHEDESQRFDRVAAVAREGGVDLGASFDRWMIDRVPGTRLRRAHASGGALTLGAAATPLAGPASMGSGGDELGVCWTRPRTEVRLDLFGGELYDARVGGPRFEEMEVGPCLATASSGDHWAIAVIAGTARTTVFFGLHDVAMGTVQQSWVHNGERAVPDVGLARRGAGFVLAPPPGGSGALELSFLHPERGTREVPVRELRPHSAAPAVAPWPWIEGAVALAGYGRSGQLELRVVGAAGEEHLRRELGVSVHADVQPALVTTDDGAFVAWLSYGDEDPTTGSLIVQRVTPEGDVVGAPITVPTGRDESLRIGGVALAALPSSGTLVVHWSDVERPVAGRTLAMLLECGPE